MKVLFLEPYPTEGPSSRYRVEQYVPYFEKNGITCAVRPFVSSRFYRILYKRGHYLKKIYFFMQGMVKRIFDIFTGLGSDIIFIHLEALPIGPPVIEWIFAAAGKKIIYDLDDAIYMRQASSANRMVKFLKFPSKVKTILKMSNHIITCNEYLGEFAGKFNPNVTVISTSVDTGKFFPVKKTASSGNVTIGWIGSYSTAPYLGLIKDVLLEVGEKHPFTLKIIGAGDYDIGITSAHIKVLNLAWELDSEIGQFQSLDIGLYPLPNDKWVLGKTGFKTMQYMSVGVPCVVSKVGRNEEIVKDGVNGFSAGSKKEWVDKISLLISNPDLRQKMGEEGRKTAEERFSVKANAPRYLEIFSKFKQTGL